MKKPFKIVVVFLLLCICAIIASDFITGQASQNHIFTNIENVPSHKVAVLLGTRKYYGGGKMVNLFYKYRIDAALELYDTGVIQYILVSGDNGTQEYDEASTMQQDLIAGGIPEENIYLDYAGFRTLDSVVRAKEIFGQESFLIISQKFHLERAIFLAQKYDISAQGFAARDVPVSRSPRVWIRERLARVKMMMDLLVGKGPKFLGEKIEIG